MALQPDLVGAVTLTSGQTTFTWAGPSLTMADVKEGDSILLPAKGLTLKVATRTSATAGTLTDPCPAAAAGSAQVARLEFQADIARVAAKTYNLIELLGSGNVSALAGLTLAADQLPYANGAGSMALTPLTAQARALLGDDSFSAMLTTLGIGSTAAVTFGSATLSSIGQVALVAERTGVGANSSIEFKTTSGSVFVGQGAANTFAVGGSANLNSAPWLAVTATNAAFGGSVLTVGGFRAYTRDIILGTVSQSGGTPTGAIIEQGSNANGSYTRFADGTQICWNPTVVTSASATVSWTYPSAFASSPTQFATSNAVVAGAVRVATIGGTGNTAANVQVVNETGSRIASSAGCLAIGRWF